MNTLPLPEPIVTYFGAEHNPEALTHCFTPQAVVKDDGHTHTGIADIKSWMAAASAKYNATTVPFDIECDDACHIVRAKVSGNFTGSPVNLTYRFRLERGLIAALEISV